MVAYTCTCSDYPLIKYCKHMCAVQTHFPEVLKLQNIDAISRYPLDTESSPAPPDLPAREACTISSVTSVGPQPCVDSGIGGLLEDLERLTVRMRMTPDHQPHPNLRNAVDQELLFLGAKTKLLPSCSTIPPNKKSWPDTRDAMMPAKKTGRKRAGDAYGGRERSSKKAKTLAQPNTTQESDCSTFV